MSSTTPIFDAETILATAIYAALAPIAGAEASGRAKAYWQLQEPDPATGKLAALPILVYQPQAPIERLDRIGQVGATALITVRALATNARAAREHLALAAPRMLTLTHEGYSLHSRYLRSPIIPPNAGVYTSAHIYRITIERMAD